MKVNRGLPINIDCIFNSEVRSAIDSNNSIEKSQYGMYTPEQKAMIETAEYGVVANLCIPDRFIRVITLYHNFHFETRGHSLGHNSTCAQGVWFRPDPADHRFFTTNHYKSEHPRKFYPPPPRKIPVIRYKLYLVVNQNLLPASQL